MSAAPVVKRSGRRGRRTGGMVRIARGRVSDLFALAERETLAGHSELADRYVDLARRIGMRYNVRLSGEYRDRYCRGCSAFWVEGRTVRTRLRSGIRVRTCLRCGRQRRISTSVGGFRRARITDTEIREVRREEGALAIPLTEESDLVDEETEEE